MQISQEYKNWLNQTEKEIAEQMKRESQWEQHYKDDELNFIAPFFESPWDIDEYNQDYDDWLHHEEDTIDEICNKL